MWDSKECILIFRNIDFLLISYRFHTNTNHISCQTNTDTNFKFIFYFDTDTEYSYILPITDTTIGIGFTRYQPWWFTSMGWIWLPNTNAYIRAMYPGLQKRRYEWKVLLKSMNNSDFWNIIGLQKSLSHTWAAHV